jgi:vancomycin resistance protein YoaR
VRKRWLLTLSLILAAAGAGIAGTAYVYGKDDRLPAGFTVGGMEVGGQPAGLSLAQLLTRVSELEQTKVTASTSSATSDGRPLRKVTFKEFGLRIDASVAVRALEKYRDRSWWERSLYRLRREDNFSYRVSISWDNATLARVARQAWDGAGGTPPQDAKRQINERDEVVYTPEAAGVKVDWAALTDRVKKLAPADLRPASAMQPLAVRVPMVRAAPRITVASLKEEGIDRKISEFTTSFTSSAAGRSHNVTAAARALNETLLQPGEIFEYGRIVDKADKEYGYREAPVIIKGKLTPGIGGGICQVSSTLYNAILQAGLDVVERRNHSLAVHYLPPGLDATFADGYVNFRFRNSTGKQLLIRTVVQNKRVTVKLFGTLPDHVAYRTETRQLKVIEPQTQYVGSASVAPGSEKRLQKGQPGYLVDTYRIKLMNGREVSRERLPRSHYRPQDELVAVHTGDSRLNPPDPAPPAEPDGPVEPM